MKKLSCLLLILVLAGTGVIFAACSANPLEKAAKNADTYTIVAAYDDKTHVLTATQTVELVNRSENSVKSVKFHVYANAYRQDAATPVVPATYRTRAYPNGDSFGDVTFDYVKVKDKAVAYTIEGDDLDILSVPVEELFPNDKVTVEMTYQIQLANIMHRLGYTDNTVNLGNFYPVLCRMQNGEYQTTPYYNLGDPYVTDCANYFVTLTVPKEYVAASSGTLSEATQGQNGTATYKFQGKALRDFAMVLSAKYQKLTCNVGDTQVNYYYYNDKNAEESLKTAATTIEYLNKNVAPYPYPTYSVCETDFCYGGMEYGALAMVTSGSNSYAEAIAHETVHQWFYGVVGSDQIQNAWMDEGLTQFVTYLYLDETGAVPIETSLKAVTKTYVSYVDVLNHYYDKVDTSFRSLADYKNDNEYVMFTYVKGSLLFGTLYDVVGESKFFKSLKAYYDGAQYTVASPKTITEAFAGVGGKELEKIFADYAEGKEILSQIIE